MNRVNPLLRTVRRAMSCFSSHAASANSPAANSGAPHGRLAPSMPAKITARTSANARRANGEGGRKRDSSRRSPAIVRIRKPSHQATTSCTAAPAAHSPTPIGQHAAPTARVKVNSAVCRRKTSSEAASSTMPPPRKNQGASPVAPATVAALPMPASQQSGPR